MATINKKAIKEILDYDAQINRRAFNATKKQVKKWDDEEQQGEEEQPPGMQLSMDANTAAREISARIKVTLEERQASLDSVLTAIKATGVTSQRNITKDLTHGSAMEDVLELYNALAGLFLQSSNTTSTKTAIKNSANRIEGAVKSMETDLRDIIDKIISVKALERYTAKLFQAYNLYNIIHTQLSRNALHKISDEELMINQKRLITHHPSWYSMSPYVRAAPGGFGDDTTPFRSVEGFTGGPGPPPDDPPPPDAPGRRWRDLIPFFDRVAGPEESGPAAASSSSGQPPPAPPPAPGAAKAKAQPIPIVPVPPSTPPPAKARPKAKAKAEPATPEVAPLPSDDQPPPPPPGAAAAAAEEETESPESPSQFGTWIEEAAHEAAAVAAQSPDKNLKSFKRAVGEAAFEGAKKVLGTSASVAKGTIGIVGDVVYNIEVGIANYAMEELSSLLQRIQRRRAEAQIKRTKEQIDDLVDKAYEKAYASIENSVRFHLKQKNQSFLDIAKKAYRAGILGSENALRGLPKDLISDIYIDMEPNIREYATKVTTVEVYKKWGESRVKEEVSELNFPGRTREMVKSPFSPQVQDTQQTRASLPQPPALPKFEPAPKASSSSSSQGAMPPIQPRFVRQAKSPPRPKTPADTRNRPDSISPHIFGPQPEDTYIRGTKVVKVTPPSIKKRPGTTEVMGETSAPSGLRQGNEPLGEGKPVSRAMRQRKKKTAIPTHKPVLQYNALKNDPYFIG